MAPVVLSLVLNPDVRARQQNADAGRQHNSSSQFCYLVLINLIFQLKFMELSLNEIRKTLRAH